jgi:hypothetical protein
MQGGKNYSLKNLEEFSEDIRSTHRITDQTDDYLVQPVLSAGSVLHEPDELVEETPQLKALLRDDLFAKDFLTTKRFNLSLLDLRSGSRADHEIMARRLDRRLNTLDGDLGPEGKVWVIHIFCYDQGRRSTPLTLSLMLLESILSQIGARASTKDLVFKVNHEPARIENSTMPNYQKTMEVLQGLIYRILEKCPENTMHFIFTGIKRMDLGYPLDELACFVIDMARLVRNVLPKQNNGMVKCIFCGHDLLETSYLFGYLEQHKYQLERGNQEEKEEIQDIVKNMLILKWNRYDGWWDEKSW